MVNFLARLKSIISKINFFKLPPRLNRIRSLSLLFQANLICLGLIILVILFNKIFGEYFQIDLGNMKNPIEMPIKFGFVIIQTFLIGLTLLVCYIKHFLISIKRLHDFNFSGWWVVLTIIPIVNIFLFLALIFAPGTKGDNKFGPQPPKASKLDYIVVFTVCILFIALIFAASLEI